MAEELTPALVLHRRRQGENHLLLELFTLSHGRLPAIARGAASPRSRRRGLLQPFVPLLVQWGGRGEVVTLRRVEPAGAPQALSGRALYCGFYLNELLVRLLPRGESQVLLFQAYRHALERLEREASPEAALRHFELELLRSLGHAPDLARERDGTPVISGRRYRFEPGSGLVRAERGIRGETLLALAAGRPPEGREGRYEARRFLRSLLAPHLGSRPLKSRELFRTMRRDSNRAPHSR